MKKLIIVNEVCSDNIGDHAINLGVLKILDEYNFKGISYGFDAEKKCRAYNKKIKERI